MKFLLILALCFIPVTAVSMSVDNGHGIIKKKYSGFKFMRDSLRINRDMKRAKRFQKRVDRTVESMVTLSTELLVRHGRRDLADDFEIRYYENFRNFFSSNKAIGDHAPFSAFLDELYVALELTIGPETIALFHLGDIKTVNYAIPLILDPNIAYDLIDFQDHFTPLAGAVSYWGVFAACAVVSYGGLAGIVIPFPCNLPANLLRTLAVEYIGPVAGRMYYCARSPDDASCN